MGYREQTVVGAGLSGLACAFRLKQLGRTPLVLERTDRAGGLIASIHKNGFLFESRPLRPRFPAGAQQVVRELNLASLLRVRRGDWHTKPCPHSSWTIPLFCTR